MNPPTIERKVPAYTKELLRKFDRLTMRLSSPRQMTRISARLELGRFQEEHGDELCREMFAELRRRDERRMARNKALIDRDASVK